MSRVDIPDREYDFKNWINTFASVATVNATLLNLTSGQTTTLNTYSTAFANALEDVDAERVVYKAKIAAKDDFRQLAEGLFRSTAKVINANENISNELKANLGITVSPTPLGPVGPPSELTAVGHENGVNKLKWSRNGNRSGTVFMIEAQIGEASTWQFVAFTTKSKYDHMGQTPGLQVVYRVLSQRDDVQSAPSNTSIVYPGGDESVVMLKAA